MAAVAVPDTKRLRLLDRPRPIYVVWEITLRCDQHCRFCGTRAGKARSDELTTDEALDVVRQLAEMGTAEVAIHGGEAYLRSDWLEIIRAIRSHGMDSTMVTGGRGFTPELARAAAGAGVTGVSVSVDGTEATHDALRGLRGSHASALAALDNLRAAGVAVGSNTQVNRKNYRELPQILELLHAHGVRGWQVQLMVPMGRAAEADDLWLQPFDMLEVIPRIAEVSAEAERIGIQLWPGNNVGYFGPHEHVLRGNRTRYGYSSGCGGGIRTLGIEANGDVKACSAMTSDGFVAGNVRQASIQELWDRAPELRFTRDFTIDQLWGYCRSCYYAESCKGGCLWTSATLLGRHGNNPYCHHRALELAREGKRERLVMVKPAEGKLRDRALFALELESVPQSVPESNGGGP
jgi:radical SAM protein with 4Fe4S-binding SPASM domain